MKKPKLNRTLFDIKAWKSLNVEPISTNLLFRSTEIRQFNDQTPNFHQLRYSRIGNRVRRRDFSWNRIWFRDDVKAFFVMTNATCYNTNKPAAQFRFFIFTKESFFQFIYVNDGRELLKQVSHNWVKRKWLVIIIAMAFAWLGVSHQLLHGRKVNLIILVNPSLFIRLSKQFHIHRRANSRGRRLGTQPVVNCFYFIDVSCRLVNCSLITLSWTNFTI